MTRTISRAVAGTLLVLLCPLLAAAPAHAFIVHAPSGGQRARVQAAATLPRGASVAGPVAAPTSVQITVSLTPSDPQGLQSYASEVSDPSSSLYRRYLSVAQFAARFGAVSSEVSDVRTALTQAGLSTGAVSANGLSLTASGTASQVEDAFDTQLEHIALSGGGSAYTDTETPTLPSAAADAVQGVVGLDTLPAAEPQGLIRARRAQSDVDTTQTTQATAGPSSCSAEDTDEGGIDTSYGIDSYTASEIGTAYGLSGLWSDDDLGAGTTVALVELQSYTKSDVATFQSCDSTTAEVTDVPVDGGAATCTQQEITQDDCGMEDVLDIEDIAGLAPDATIDVYEGPDTPEGLFEVYQRIVESGAQVVSTSWGECEASAGASTLNEENTLFEEAAVQGQAVFAAAGDEGADDCKTANSDPQVRAVDDPASQPYVTGVGGTTMTSDAPGATETVWDDSEGAGGGGVSRYWSVPSWQRTDAVSQSADAVGGATLTCTATPDSSATSTSCREVPDVTADADPETGYDVYWDGAWTVVGGTSAAAPTWASLVALVDQSSGCAADSVQIGFANPLLYGLPSSDFYDVTAVNNSYSGTSGYKALSGYDMASGLGVPNATALAPALCASGTTRTPPPATTETTPTTTTGQPTATTPVSTTTTKTTTTTTTTVTTTKATHRAPGADVAFAATSHRRRARVGRRVRDRLRAHDRLGLRVVYSAHRLPAGLRINRRTGVITGVPRHAGRVTSSITAGDTAGDAESVVIRWTIVARR